jgi:hypothetical protein
MIFEPRGSVRQDEGLVTNQSTLASLIPLVGTGGSPCLAGSKVESGVGLAKRTPLKALRFETLEEARTYRKQSQCRIQCS